MDLTTFYSRRGAVFGATGPMWDTYHHGDDYPWAAGTPIPSWTAGEVVASTWSYYLGWVLQLRRADRLIAGFCHLQERSPLRIGDVVRVGTTIGKVGATGAQVTGAHLHTTLEPTLALGTSRALNPRPYIVAAMTSAASSSTARLITSKGRTRMLYHLVSSSPTRYALAGTSPGTPANWLESTDQGLANAWSSQVGGPSAGINQQTWDQYKAGYTAGLTVKGA